MRDSQVISATNTVPPPSAPSHPSSGARWVVPVCLLVFMLLVAGKIHGFSIGCWDGVGFSPTRSSFQCGVPRWIRLDEWRVSTPQVLAQCAAPGFFPAVNPRVGGGTDMAISTPGNPIWDITVPAQFHNWGYFLFGAERGLSWNWWCRFLGLPLFAWLFFLPSLGHDRLLAAAAALAVALAAPTQWWDTTLPYILLYFFASLVFLRQLFLPGVRLAGKSAAALGLAVSLSSYSLAGYPVWEILLFPPLLFMAMETAHDAWHSPASLSAPPRCPALPFALLFLVLAFLAAELVCFARLHADALRLVASSAYPGARVCLGGDFPQFLRHIGLDVLSFFLPYSAFSPDFAAYAETNVCRASRYFVPGTALLALLLFRRRFSLRLRPASVALLLWGGVLLAWSSIPVPLWLAKASGLSPFPPHRAEVAAGFVFLLLVFRLFAASEASPPRLRFLPPAVVLLSTSAALAAILLPSAARTFFASPAGLLFLAIGLLLAGAVSWGLADRRRLLFCGGYIALSLISGLPVHPLSAGISPIRDTRLADLVRAVDAQSPGRWISNTYRVGNYLLALGLDCHPGTQPYADPAFWRVLDPSQASERQWNRYAHRLLELEQPGAPFIRAQGDVLRFSVNESQLRALGVSHLVWDGSPLREPWLKEEGHIHSHYVYTLLPPAP